MSNQNIFCVVGNPNCGKTTLFNALTGSKQKVGNWPGVTVDKKTGTYTYEGAEYEVVDLPGIYSITPSSAAGEDERVARDYIVQTGNIVVNILDASNLERNLYLTAQLIEMRVPVICVANMLDIAKEHGVTIDTKKLAEKLGCPVVGIIASRDEGVAELKKVIADFVKNPTIPPHQIVFPADVQETVEKVNAQLKHMGVTNPSHYVMQIVENAPKMASLLPEGAIDQLSPIVEPLYEKHAEDLDIILATARYNFAENVCKDAMVRPNSAGMTLSEKIDSVILNRWLGLPIFLVIMYVMFLFTQNLGAAFIDFFDILVGGVMVDGFGELLASMGCPDWLRVLLANGIGGGLQTVSTFIPVVFFLFFFLSILEDSGYMARAAFVMDRLMRSLGLPGKAFVPLIVGFGCTVPAIMASRTMNRAIDRIITIMMAPFMSCGARLPVYVLFATAFFPTDGQNLVFGLYLIGILAAILTGFVVKTFAMPAGHAALVMEIPPYHIPTFRGVMIPTFDRVKAFMKRAGRVIVVIVAVLGFLNSMGTDGSFGNEDTNESVLSEIGRTIVPVLQPMGVSEENWPAAVGVFTGILAKEAVVGTMNSLYDTMARIENENAAAAAGEAAAEEEEESAWSFSDTFAEAWGTIGENLAGLTDVLTDPAGVAVGDLSDTAAAAEEQEVTMDSVTMMQSLFGDRIAAFAYLLVVLLYMPCGAAVAAVKREAGTAWMLFLCGWTTALGYGAATIFYRTFHFADDPLYAIVSIAISLAVIVGMVLWMRCYAKKHYGEGKRIIPIAAAK